MAVRLNTHDEWLEPDGLGGFASGTVSGIRTRRYHALLLTAVPSPVERLALVNGLDAWVTTPNGNYALTAQVYEPGVVSPNGWERIDSFETTPWPTWRYKLPDATEVIAELFVPRGNSAVVLTWRVSGDAANCALSVRPFLSVRDYHATHRESQHYVFDPILSGGKVAWRPYPKLPSVHALSDGEYIHGPQWYRNFIYEEERARGLEYTEDLASPGTFRWDLGASGTATLIFAAESHQQVLGAPNAPVESIVEGLQYTEKQRRSQFSDRLHKAADAFIVKQDARTTIVAGYPWFTDWGWDTFIALRGLCLSTGRLDDAERILLEWAGTVSEGMLPDALPNPGMQPSYSSVDASLWFIIAVHDFVSRLGKQLASSDAQIAPLRAAVESILQGYSRGTRHNIHMAKDGLLASGEHGTALTWMDVRVGDWTVTPRIGKPVEVQALWLNVLRIGGTLSAEFESFYNHAMTAFETRFWNETGRYLNDVVDCDHVPGAVDTSLRPNQILAIGGLPFPIITGERARQIVNTIESRLLTSIGLRTLAPGQPGYHGHYEGGIADRDGAYHQGTVWPWLMGPFIEAWLRVRNETPEAKEEARARFLAPLLEGLDHAGLDSLSEIADGDAPHAPRGCPFYAASVGEALRIQHDVLA